MRAKSHRQSLLLYDAAKRLPLFEANRPGLTPSAFGAMAEIRQSAPMALQRITKAGDESLILILSDINMPGMSGLELLPKAKAMRPDVPIIMITAYGDAETKRRALEDGAEALLTKPIDFGTLRSEIDICVGRVP